MKIILRSVQFKKCRNKNVGDWRIYRNGTIVAMAAKSGDDRSDLAVAIHEAIEAFMCHKAGIRDGTVTAFDAVYERERDEGRHGEFDEAGDDHRAPYRIQHQAATMVERAVCKALGLSWDDHSDNVEAILQPEPVGELCHGFARSGK